MGEFRICMRGGIVLREKKVNFKTVYYGYDTLSQLWVDTLVKLYDNVTIFVSHKDFTVCYDRLKTNESDFATEFYQQPSDDTFYHVPVSNQASRMTMLSGYDTDDVRPQTVNALKNFGLIEVNIYLLFLAFISLSMVIVAAVTWLEVRSHVALLTLLGERDRMSIRFYKMRREMNQGSSIVRQVRRRMEAILYGTSTRFRWLSILLNILIFYLVAHFRSVYSTNSIIVKKPQLVESYSDLLRHPGASPFFMNFLIDSTEQFSGAPRNTMRGKIWTRAAQLDMANSLVGERWLNLFTKSYESMKKNSSVLITSITTATCKLLYCALSPEGKLRHFATSADESEGERLLGYPVSSNFRGKKIVARRLQLFTESGCFFFIVDMMNNQIYSQMARMTGKSEEHTLQQKLVCDKDVKVDMHAQPDTVTLKYYGAFIKCLIGLITLSLYVLVAECCIARLAKRDRVSHSRRPRALGHCTQ